MTLNDIIMHDLAIGRREQERRAAERELKELKKAERRQAWKAFASRYGAIIEGIGMVATVAMFIGLMWAFMSCTPDQISAEAEACRVEMETTAR